MHDLQTPPLSPEARVGSYILERRLGAGAMGEVWLGRHAISGGLGAVKSLRRDARDPWTMLRYFQREARAISRLRHPHVVAVFEIGDAHIVYQYIDGQDLARKLRTPMDPAMAVRLIRQIASALAHAHERGLVHRDVKPANVLLDKTGNAYLADFGLAITEGERPEAAAGTPDYAAPEQWGRGLISAAADQYALGRTLCEMLAGGSLPRDQRESLAQLPVDLPSALKEAVARATALDPTQRFASVVAFASALENVDVSAYTPPVRLAPEVRPRAPFAFCAAPVKHVNVAPELTRADYLLSRLAAEGRVSADEARRFFVDTGYADLGFSLYASSCRLGPLTDPASLARASEVVVLLHGWAGTREVWENVAPALCRDQAQAVVLVPDFWGFGASPFATAPTAEQSALPASIAAIRRLTRLLRLDGVPTVLVGHSLSATALLLSSDHDLGPATSRIAINPVFPAYDAAYRDRIRIGMAATNTIGRVPALRRWLVNKMVREAPSVRELAPEVCERMAEAALSVRGAIYTAMFRAVLTDQRMNAEPHRRALLLLGQNDPLISDEALAAAVSDLKLSPNQVVRLATGGHYPHLESAAHPEWTARNVAEIVHHIGQMLLASSESARSSIESGTASASTLAADPEAATVAAPSA